MEVVFQILSAGGNVAMMFVAFALWRVDRRLVRVETHVFGADGMRE